MIPAIVSAPRSPRAETVIVPPAISEERSRPARARATRSLFPP